MDNQLEDATSLQPNVYGPITAGQVYERTFALLRKNLKLFFGIVLVAVGVEVVIGTVLGFSGIWTRRTVGGNFSPVLMAPLALLGAAMIYVFTQIIQGALFFATRAQLAGAPVNVGEACGLAANKVGKIVGISLLVALRMLGYLVLFYSAFAVVVLVVALMFGGAGHLVGGLPFRSGVPISIGMYVVFGLFGAVFLMFYLVCILWLLARYALAIPACLGEGLGVGDSIRRSLQLTAKSKGRIYALFVGVAAAWIAITLITLPIQLLSAMAALRNATMAPAMVGAISFGLAGFRIVTGGIVIAFIGIATTLCYFDLRVRKEQFGAAPLDGTASPVPAITLVPVEPANPGPSV
ncbi:MAG: hypothetical protein ACYDC6_12105 [Acidobacteriaceae bacterium]